MMLQLYPMQVGYRKYGQLGIEMTDWWPHFGEVVDDVAFVRSLWTTDNDHGAQYQFHTGRQVLDGLFPVHRILGSLRPRHAER